LKEKQNYPTPKIEAIKELFYDEEDPQLLVETPYPKSDDVNRPDHYTRGIEVTDFISSWNMDWFRGNILKYIVRCPYKGNTIKDLEKAKWYIDDLITRLKKGESVNACF